MWKKRFRVGHFKPFKTYFNPNPLCAVEIAAGVIATTPRFVDCPTDFNAPKCLRECLSSLFNEFVRLSNELVQWGCSASSMCLSSRSLSTAWPISQTDRFNCYHLLVDFSQQKETFLSADLTYGRTMRTCPSSCQFLPVLASLSSLLDSLKRLLA